MKRAAPCRPLGSLAATAGTGHKPFALGGLAGGFAGTTHGFASLAGFLLRRLLVGAAALHFTEQAFALKLLFQDPEGLVDIVVANGNLQRTSPLIGFCPDDPGGSYNKSLRIARKRRVEPGTKHEWR